MTNEIMKPSDEPNTSNEANNNNTLLSDEEFDNAFKEFSDVVANQYGVLINRLLSNRLKSDGSELTDEEYQQVVKAFDRGRSYRIGRSVKTITLSNSMKVDVVIDVESIIRLNHGKETDSWFD